MFISVTLKSLGKTSVGWPLITYRQELSLQRLASRSSRHCNKNLKQSKGQEQHQQKVYCYFYWLGVGPMICKNLFLNNLKQVNDVLHDALYARLNH